MNIKRSTEIKARVDIYNTKLPTGTKEGDSL